LNKSSHRLQRLPRLTSQLGALDLFARLDRSPAQTRLTDADRVDAFMGGLRVGLESALRNPSRIHGWHVQAMFGEVLQALDHCLLIKEEDQGQAWTGGDVALPDYRVVLPGGENLLIEVKNHHAPADRPFELRASNLDGLRRYSDLAAGRPMVAVFFAVPGLWTLLDPEAFSARGRRATIDLGTAMAENEMGLVGDYLIGTRPPITLTFRMDEDTAGFKRDRDGTRSGIITLGAASITCGGKAIDEPTDQALAIYLIQFGRWEETMDSAFSGDILRSISFTYEPIQWDERQGFAMIGFLSEFHSQEFVMRTMTDGQVSSLSAQLDPGPGGFALAQHHKPSQLPLWRFKLQRRSARAP
jgi:Holliday junction resolvase